MMHDLLRERWTALGEKVVLLAEAMPEESYELRPSPEVRSFGDQLRHVAFWNECLGGRLRGEAPDGSADELPRADFPDKARILGVLRQSFDHVAGELVRLVGAGDGSALERLVPFLEHNGEHYGQLVVYCRLSGIVPPASRSGAECRAT